MKGQLKQPILIQDGYFIKCNITQVLIYPIVYEFTVNNVVVQKSQSNIYDLSKYSGFVAGNTYQIGCTLSSYFVNNSLPKVESITTAPLPTSWSSGTLSGGGYGLAYGKGVFVTIGYNTNKALYSTDGITWTEVSLGSTANWYGITYGDGCFVAVGSDSQYSFSYDGINWSSGSIYSSSSYTFYGIAYGNGMYVATPSSGTTIFVSEDGRHWRTTNGPVSSSQYTRISFANGRFYMGGYYSLNGVNWTKLPSGTSGNFVCFGVDRYVGIYLSNSSSSNYYYSTDGLNWTTKTLPESAVWGSVAYGNGKFVITPSGSKNFILYSTDGLNWTKVTIPKTSWWQGVQYGTDRFVATGQSSSSAIYCIC